MARLISLSSAVCELHGPNGAACPEDGTHTHAPPTKLSYWTERRARLPNQVRLVVGPRHLHLQSPHNRRGRVADAVRLAADLVPHVFQLAQCLRHPTGQLGCPTARPSATGGQQQLPLASARFATSSSPQLARAPNRLRALGATQARVPLVVAAASGAAACAGLCHARQERAVRVD